MAACTSPRSVHRASEGIALNFPGLAPMRLPFSFAQRHGIILVDSEASESELLIRPDASIAAISEVRRECGPQLKLTALGKTEFDARLSSLYAEATDATAEIMADLEQDEDLERLMTELPQVSDLLESQDDAPIIKLINALLSQAIRDRVSDIHIEPYQDRSLVRFRRDGLLSDVAHPHRGLHAALVSRIKVMANLDIAEKRLPQDGRIGLRIGGKQVDVRVSSTPTTHGERLVLRVLDKSAAVLSLDSLGMSAPLVSTLSALISQPHGIVLVTGPTGSGKSTTLYAALQSLDTAQLNVVSVEDPVEYDLPGVGQIHANQKIGLTFAKALRSILRQDPDVIMIGEIRDTETAQIAVQASLTGHLVLATLHTNDALSAVTRLIDMGVEPFLLASTLRGVLAQRLVRVLCSHCRLPVVESVSGEPAWSAAGCEQCRHSGYQGRTGIYEIMQVDAEIQRMIHQRVDESLMRQYLDSIGTQTLRQDGLRHVRSGVTSFEEVLRATRD